MASEVSAEFIFKTISDHLSSRDDLWHIVNGPKRETWFTAETIAALSRRSPASLSAGFRVYGEESYSCLAAILNEYGLAAGSASSGDSDEWRRIPDVTVTQGLCNDEASTITIIEAKLVSPVSERTGDEVEMLSDFDSQVKALGNTAKCDGLLDQLDRARRLVPVAHVFGLVFAVHRLGQCAEVCPNRFFGNLASKIAEIFQATHWRLWDGKVKPVAGLQSISPLGGMFSGQASLGVGILLSGEQPTDAAATGKRLADKEGSGHGK
jgi:hypothetical protein